MHWLSENFKWLFDGFAGLVVTAVAGYLIRFFQKRSSEHQSGTAALNTQGAKVTNSPVASGSHISQNINSPTLNLSLPTPSFGAPGRERYKEWRELIDEIHESIEQMGYAFVPIVAHQVGDERCDYQAGIRRGNRILRNRILIAETIQKSKLTQLWDELVQYAHSGRGPRDRWEQGSPTMGGFDVKARAFQEKLMRAARDDMDTRDGIGLPLQARESDRQALAKRSTAQEDRSSWPDVILECQWPSIFDEPKIAGSHTVRRRPWTLRNVGPGTVYNVSICRIDFGEYEAVFLNPPRILTDVATVHPTICRKLVGQQYDAAVVSSHDLESLIRNPPLGCDIWRYAVKTDDFHEAEDGEEEEIGPDDSSPEVKIPVTISYDDKNGNQFRIKYHLHYESCIEKGEMARSGSIEKLWPKPELPPATVMHDKPPEKSAPQVPKQTPDSSAGKWTKKEIVAAVVVPVVIVLIGSVLAWMTPEVRRWLHLDKPQEQHAPIQSVPAPMPHDDSMPQSKAEQVPTKDKVDATVKPAPSQTVTATVGHPKKQLRTKIGDLISEGTKIRNIAPVYVGDPVHLNGEPDVMAEWTAWSAKVEQFLKANFDAAEVAKYRSLDDPNVSLNAKIHAEIAYLEQLLDKVGQEPQASTTNNASGGIINNGGVITNPTINNGAPPAPKPEPDLGMEFVSPQDVAFRMVNLSNAIVRDAKYTFILVDLDGPRTVGSGDGAIPQILQIPTTVNSGDFLKPKHKYMERPMSTFQGVQAVVKPGDRIFGYVTVTCPDCVKERRYWVYFVNGPGGWYYEFTGDGSVQFPIGPVLTNTEKTLAQIAPVQRRIPISNPN
jgi:hypothetical protein